MARWDRLTTKEISQLIGGGMDLAVLPVGATEQHGPHLATGTDTISADLVATRSADNAGVLVLPALPYGCSHGHTELWPGTISLDPVTLTSVICEVSRWALRSGIKRLVYLSGHATNGPSLSSAILRLRYEEREARFRQLGLWDISRRASALYTRDAPDFHANRAETSLMLHAAPELVRMEEAADTPDVTIGAFFQYPPPRTTRTGVVGNPTEATAEDGLSMLTTLVDDLTLILKSALVEPWHTIG